MSWREKKMFHEEITLKLNFSLPKNLGHSFFPVFNSCYHYCWLISWCWRKNSFMGTWRGHNWIILAFINGSANHSPHCCETDFHNFWVKACAPEQGDAQSGGEMCSLTSWVQRPSFLPSFSEVLLSCTFLEHYHTGISFSFPRWGKKKISLSKLLYICLWGAVNQDWFLKKLLENIKALLYL